MGEKMDRALRRLFERRPDLKEKFVNEHKRLVNVLRSPSHKDDLVEAKDQAEELETYKKVKRKKKLRKAVLGYVGPTTIADITLASWNEFFREGGVLNQPIWLQSNRLKALQHGFEKMARYHAPIG